MFNTGVTGNRWLTLRNELFTVFLVPKQKHNDLSTDSKTHTFTTEKKLIPWRRKFATHKF